ncbi:hypothetical protein CCP2SC5_360026 [Azospirillaceae bacterium]
MGMWPLLWAGASALCVLEGMARQEKRKEEALQCLFLRAWAIVQTTGRVECRTRPLIVRMARMAPAKTEDAGKKFFARRYKEAHSEAGIKRLSMAEALEQIVRGDSASEKISKDWLCPYKKELTTANYDRLQGNLFLSGMLVNLLPFLSQRMAEAKERGDGPFGVFQGEISQNEKLLLLRSACCITLNEVLDIWAKTTASKPIRCPITRLYDVARRFFGGSTLYLDADHTPISLAKTGSNTAIHVCWCMVEAMLAFNLPLSPEECRDVVWRSRKEAMTLASGSLGMIVHFLEDSHLHPPHDSAVYPVGDSGAFWLEETGAGLRMRLDPTHIKPFSSGNDLYYTGCPAFYIEGMIERYLEWVLDIALFHNLMKNGQS